MEEGTLWGDGLCERCLQVGADRIARRGAEEATERQQEVEALVEASGRGLT